MSSRDFFFRSETIPDFARTEQFSNAMPDAAVRSSRRNPQDRTEQLDRDYALLGCDAPLARSLIGKEKSRSISKESDAGCNTQRRDWGARPRGQSLLRSPQREPEPARGWELKNTKPLATVL